jgi:hypothetical protein
MQSMFSYPSSQSNVYQDTSPFLNANLFLLNRFLNSRQKRLRVCTHNLLNLLLVLEDQEGRHSADAELLGNIGDLVDVELDEVGAGELLGEPNFLLLLSAIMLGW